MDISTTIERKIGGTSEVLPTIIRSANRKSMFEISEEIRKAKETEIDKSDVYKTQLKKTENMSYKKIVISKFGGSRGFTMGS